MKRRIIIAGAGQERGAFTEEKETSDTAGLADELAKLAMANKETFQDPELQEDMRLRLLYGGWVYTSDRKSSGVADLWSAYKALLRRYGRFNPRTGKGKFLADCEDQSTSYMAWWSVVSPYDWVEVGIIPGISIDHALGRVADRKSFNPECKRVFLLPAEKDKHILDLCIYTGMGPMPHGYHPEIGEWRKI